ncbi:MAG: IS30 family transposase [Eubacterium sp.]|jgi:IS30 family transposase|nr:IS30 family transposase [Eubacterium sp.]
MDQLNFTTITPDRERGQHLRFEERCSIKIFKKLGYSLRKIAQQINCSPSTVMYELRRGTGIRKGNRGRFPQYSARRGQRNYEINRSRCHKSHKIADSDPFLQWMYGKVNNYKWSLDSCVGYAKRQQLFPTEQIPCTKTLYNELWAGNLELPLTQLPEALSRKSHKNRRTCQNKRVLGKSIEKRPEEVLERISCGHWEIDTVVGRKRGSESVVLTLLEKKTDYYMAIKIPGKDADSVMAALEVFREEYNEHFTDIFKSITADNGTEFSRLSELEEYGVDVYFAHPYSSWERPQNERHNRILRRYIPKGVSINRYSADQILSFADEINALPRRPLGYCTPEELFEAFLDQVYSVDKVHST